MSLQIELAQYECPICLKKIYINNEDTKEEIGCAYCDIPKIKYIRIFKLEILQILEKEE